MKERVDISQIRRKDAAVFRKRLLHWYARNKRDLPWRKTKDSYRIWISEVMLQQTTVKAAVPYYEKWLKIFPDIKALSRATEKKVLKTWQGLGFYQRARSLLLASKIFSEKFNGQIPDNYDRLLRLPGFGAYTAGALMSMAFQKPYPVVEANIKRVFSRLLCKEEPKSPDFKESLKNVLKRLVPKRRPGDFNQAIMELGALVCRKRHPGCLMCPVKCFCLAYERGVQEVVPFSQKKNYETFSVAAGIIRQGKRYLIQKRPDGGPLAGLWEFPGGKRLDNETLEECLEREILEELGVRVKKKRFLMQVVHYYTRFKIRLSAFQVVPEKMPDKLFGRRWVTLRQMRSYPFPSGSSRIVDYLEKEENALKGNHRGHREKTG
ncbi:MAG: A/G-specific adenine glycosylase [Candidatus Aureabacteria bacterium]|nr:A/G-specific adenine glycosylase [Candidatus Auribacterota bacterium]